MPESKCQNCGQPFDGFVVPAGAQEGQHGLERRPSVRCQACYNEEYKPLIDLHRVEDKDA